MSEKFSRFTFFHDLFCKIHSLNLIWKIIIALGGLAVFACLALYLWTPYYRFEDCKPFHGEYVHNPYQDVNFSNWHCYNSDFEDVGHPQKTHPFARNIHIKQFEIDRTRGQFGLVALRRPRHNYKLREMKNLDHYRLLEYDENLDYWDMALSHGHRANILGKANVLAVSPDNSDSIRKSLETGDFYVVEPLVGLDFPRLTEARLCTDTFFVSVDRMAAEIRFIGQDGGLKMSVKEANKAFFVFRDCDSYIRTEIRLDDGSVMYLNPVVRHPYKYFFDYSKVYVMKGRTWLIRVAFLAVVAFIFKRLFFKPKEEND